VGAGTMPLPTFLIFYSLCGDAWRKSMKRADFVRCVTWLVRNAKQWPAKKTTAPVS
jgi:hypothetical protein